MAQVLRHRFTQLIGHVQAKVDVTPADGLAALNREFVLSGALVWPNKPQGIGVAYSCKTT
ncbi:hypothetical protein SB14R_00805 [Pseudomonas oryzihabitans]|nr:hypothetical protein NS376_04530 [Pseudomonas psychrotolerans]KTT26975.1 hypothetical protein SB14R_00805 [Pseudomonas psychrotolerans]